MTRPAASPAPAGCTLENLAGAARGLIAGAHGGTVFQNDSSIKVVLPRVGEVTLHCPYGPGSWQVEVSTVSTRLDAAGALDFAQGMTRLAAVAALFTGACNV